jgi:phage terminase small subunit
MPLNSKQLNFAREYIIDHNATQAAIRAGYSKATANQSGPRLLVNVGVQAEVTRLEGRRAGRLNLTADFVLEGIIGTTREARDQGEFAACLKGYELLGKHLKLFTDRQEYSGEGGGPIRVICDL